MISFENLLKSLAKPAQRALRNAGINSWELLLKFNEAELLSLHGIGKNAMFTIKNKMAEAGLTLKEN